MEKYALRHTRDCVENMRIAGGCLLRDDLKVAFLPRQRREAIRFRVSTLIIFQTKITHLEIMKLILNQVEVQFLRKKLFALLQANASLLVVFQY